MRHWVHAVGPRRGRCRPPRTSVPWSRCCSRRARPATPRPVCGLWGLAVGLRALWPGTSRPGRATLAAVAGGWQLLAWWLLLGSRHVTLTEAYTLPLAAVALLGGWAALRGRPELRSWVAYGPALAAVFLPSLALVLSPTSDDSVRRRLLLGVGALAVVFAGAIRRRQAPVVVGGIVVALVALHELALVWYLLPTWIPLSLGGLTPGRPRHHLRTPTPRPGLASGHPHPHELTTRSRIPKLHSRQPADAAVRAPERIAAGSACAPTGT